MTTMTLRNNMLTERSIPPHGGELVDRVVADPDAARRMVDECKAVLRIRGQTARQIINIAYGFFSPLKGFMNQAQLESVCRRMCLPDGAVWTLPVLFDLNSEQLGRLGVEPGDHILLEYHNIPFAVLQADEIYDYDQNDMILRLFGMDNVDHPGIRRCRSMGRHCIGGEVWLINMPIFQEPYDRFFFPPRQIRERFARRRWRRVAAMLASSVPHLGHEWVMKSSFIQHNARGILVNCAVGDKGIGDCIDEAVLLCHHELEQTGYFNEFMHLTAMVLWDKQYAGPREAIMHAIIARNMGCTGHVFGKHHASAPEFSAPYASQEIFSEIPDLGIEPLLAREWYHCDRCGGITYSEFCNHRDEREKIESVNICSLLSTGIKPPTHLLRPEVFDVSIGAADRYGFGDGYVTEEYLRKRNPIFTLARL